MFFVFNRRDATDFDSLPTDSALRRAIRDRLVSGRGWSPPPAGWPDDRRTSCPPCCRGSLAPRCPAGSGRGCATASVASASSRPTSSPRPSCRSLTEAIYAANPRALIAIDEEGGDVTRLFAGRGSPSPGNAVLGRLDDLGTTAYAARQIGAQLRQAGVNVNFAPSVDINSKQTN